MGGDVSPSICLEVSIVDSEVGVSEGVKGG